MPVCVVESGSRAGELQDLLTCGDCLEEFPLSDIVRFIRHKVSHGGGHCVSSSPPADDQDDADPDGELTTRRGAGERGAEAEECGETVVDDHLRQASPSRGLVCDSSLPGDDAAAADNRLNGDAHDCFNDRSTGQLSTVHCCYITGPCCFSQVLCQSI